MIHDKLTNAINLATNSGKVVDISRMTPDGKGIKICQHPVIGVGNKIVVPKLSVASNNYANYKFVINILGPEYIIFLEYFRLIIGLPRQERQYHAQYYRLLLQIKEDPQYFIRLLSEDLSVFIYELDKYRVIMNALSPDYKDNYYNLAIEIIDRNHEQIKEILAIIDPRDHNALAYRIAVYIGNHDITDMIEDIIMGKKLVLKKCKM